MLKSNLLLLIGICFVGYVAAQGGCTGTIAGHNYNFAALSVTGDYNITGSSGSNKWLIRLNMCKAITNLGTPPCNAGASGCQWWDLPTPSYRQTLGLANTMAVSALQDGTGKQKGYTASFTGGTNFNGKDPVVMEINFICSESAGNGFPTVTQTTGNDFKFDWNTNLACTGGSNGGGGGKKGMSGGAVFLILLFCIPTVYLITGVIVNKFVRHQDGLEMIPNVAFWSGFLALIKDGVKFIGVKTCMRGGYSQV